MRNRIFLGLRFPSREIPQMVAPCADNPIVKVEYTDKRTVLFTLANGQFFEVHAFEAEDEGGMCIGVSAPIPRTPTNNKEEQ